MTTADYSYHTTKAHLRPGRGNFGLYTAEITGPDGFSYTSPRCQTEQEAADWAQRFIDAKAAGRVQAPLTRPAPAAPSRPVQPARRQVDRQAQGVADLMGFSSPRPTGGCMYCGQRLVRGQCEECG